MTAGMMTIIGVYAGMGVVSFVTMGFDKFQATRGRRRISERRLHGLEILGGIVGSFLGQVLFRHKIRKGSYQAAYWTIVALHGVGWYLALGR